MELVLASFCNRNDTTSTCSFFEAAISGVYCLYIRVDDNNVYQKIMCFTKDMN